MVRQRAGHDHFRFVSAILALANLFELLFRHCVAPFDGMAAGRTDMPAVRVHRCLFLCRQDTPKRPRKAIRCADASASSKSCPQPMPCRGTRRAGTRPDSGQAQDLPLQEARIDVDESLADVSLPGPRPPTSRSGRFSLRKRAGCRGPAPRQGRSGRYRRTTVPAARRTVH